jgi:4-amino-4-deoxy-L-arabinose transferase-like glycosyltransferase
MAFSPDLLAGPALRARLQLLFVAGAFAGLAAVLFAAAMTNPLNYDEEQYIAGAYFARELSMYRDFISIQPPTYTWMLAGLFELVGGWYLLTGRLVTWLFSLFTCLLLYSLMVSYGAGRIAAFVLLIGFVTSPFLDVPLTTTRNDIVPLFLFVLGIWLCTEKGALARSFGRMLATGVALGLAAATKYLYLFAAPVLILLVLYWDWRTAAGEGGARLQRAAWLVAGALIGALPVVYALVRNGEQYIVQTLVFHLQAVPEYYQQQGFGEMLGLKYKMQVLPKLLVAGGNATVALVLVFSTIVAWRARRKGSRNRRARSPVGIVLTALLAGAFVLSIRVGPYAMYYAPVSALAVLLAAYAFAAARAHAQRWAVAAVLASSLILAWDPLVMYKNILLKSVDRNRWTGVQTHHSALEVARAIAQQGPGGHVATLFPILVLDANPMLPQFSGGPFFFRNAGSFSTGEIERRHGAGPQTIDRLFQQAPPAAILGNFGPFYLKWNPPMDAALLDYAKRAGYVQVPKNWSVRGYPKGELWVRPGTASAAHGAPGS